VKYKCPNCGEVDEKDVVWWYSGHSEIQPGGWYEYPGFGQVYVQEYIIVVLYD
jgi:hypothetical protein